METFSFFEDTSVEIDKLMNQFECEYGSLEGLNSSIIGRLFVSIADTFTGLLSTFGSNLVNINKTLKRGELREFVSSNRLRVMTVTNMDYAKLVDVEIDLPANMKGTYLSTVNHLLNVYQKLNALNTGKLAQSSFIEILNSVNSEDKKIHQQIDSVSNVVGGIAKTANPAIEASMKDFTGKFAYKMKFSDAFLTMEEFARVKELLLDNEFRLQDVHKMTEIIASIEATLKSLCASISDVKTPLSPNDLRNLAETAKSVALVFDAYGTAATRQMAIEHNYILCVNHLYTTVK